MLSVLIGFAIVAGMVVLAMAPGSFGFRRGGMDVRGWERRRRALARVTNYPVDADLTRQEEVRTGSVRVIEESAREGAAHGDAVADATTLGGGDPVEAERDGGRLAA